ncbi:YciI family protein [Nocardioides endophyticus]|uniref:YciI family protein n=1 Tax=Nocardioides endophyticus TaxID=1353775 RepID=A0ABP8YYG7_9ACTN
MRFLVLMTEADHFATWDAASESEQQAVFDAFQAFDKAVIAAGGELVGGEALTRPTEARTLRPGADRVVTEGPYAKTVEQLGGFYLVELPDIDAAIEAARLLPSAYTIEVRPVQPT